MPPPTFLASVFLASTPDGAAVHRRARHCDEVWIARHAQGVAVRLDVRRSESSRKIHRRGNALEAKSSL